MALSTTCATPDSGIITVEAALALKQGKLVGAGKFYCISCGETVRPHKRGIYGAAAHFEHVTWNQSCKLSAKYGYSAGK